MLYISDVKSYFCRILDTLAAFLSKPISGYRLFSRSTFLYTVISIPALLLIFSPFHEAGKSLFRIIDGTEQHYLFFVYIGRWIREGFLSFFSGNGFSLPIWDLSLGYGSDMYVSLAAYIFDPFNWVSIIVPASFTELIFNITLLLRLYIAGYTFLLLCRRYQFTVFSSVISALLYSTCAVTLVLPIESFFVNPMIWFPLILIGADKIFKGESPNLFIVSLAIMFITYFYFGYMACVVLFPLFLIQYIVIGFGPTYNRSALDFIATLFKCIGYILGAVCLAGFILVPVMYIMLNSGRIGLERPTGLIYDFTYYIRLIGGFAGWADVGADSYWGFGVIGLICLFLFWLSKNDNNALVLKLQILVLLIFMCFPFFGKMLNGFAYVTNRWTWGFAVFLCIAVARVLQFEQIRKYRIAALLIFITCYSLLLISYRDVLGNYTWVISFLLFFSFSILYFILKSKIATEIKKIASFVFIILIVIANSCYVVRDKFCGNSQEINGEQKYGYALRDLTTSNISNAIKELCPDSNINNWRYDVSSRWGGGRNSSLLQQLPSYDFYLSMYNNYVDQLHSDLGLLGTDMNVQYLTMDSRSYLEQAFGTRYMAIRKNDYHKIPFGYAYIGSNSDNSVDLYESDSYRPIVSIMDNIINENSYSKLSMVDKAEALASGIVLDDESIEGTDFVSHSFAINPKEVSVVQGSAEIAGNSITTFEDNTILELVFDTPANTEMYISLPNLVAPDNIGRARQQALIYFQDINGNQINMLVSRPPQDHMYGGKNDWAVNLGILPTGENTIRIVFESNGYYSSSNPQIIAQNLEPLEHIQNTSAELNNKVSKYVFDGNNMNITVTADDNDYLLISTPYSSGWSATIDGAETKVYRANTAFLAVEIPRGTHEIILRYHTPGLLLGVFLSVVSVVFLIVNIVRKRCVSIFARKK